MDFHEALTRAYLAHPCQVLANPLWKTLAMLPGCQSSFTTNSAGNPNHFEIWRGTELLLYWDTDRSRLKLPAGQMDAITFALMHEDYRDEPQLKGFSKQTAYFRLALRSEQMKTTPSALPPGYSFRPIHVQSEASAVAGLIGRCYECISPSPETVRAWTQHPVYAPELWLWIWDEAHDCPAGSGIAEIDPTIAEGALEWTQVLPEYQGRGLGSALVRELLRRMGPRTSLITVSGEVQNEANPQRLYRRCGFTGQDVWWVLQK